MKKINQYTIKKIQLITFYILVTCIFLFNVFILSSFKDIFVSNQWELEIQNLLVLFLLESILVQWLYFMVYQDPIKDLEYTIKSFVMGQDISWKLKKLNTINPRLLYILDFFFKTIGTLKNIKEEFLSGKSIKWEVHLAQELQWKLLYKAHKNPPSIEIIAKSKPAWEVGWDSFDIIEQQDNYYIYVWDATGHWVWAWFVMVMVNALVSWFSKVYKTWSAILANTNEILKPRLKSNILMSLLMVRWNETEKRLFMTWAWHEYLMIYKHKQKKCFRIKSGWVALWMTKNVHKILKEQEISFEPNDIFVLYSDWITEAINQPFKNWNEKMFLEDRLVQTIETSPNVNWKDLKSARSVFNNITIELSKFMGYKHVQLDDVTLIVGHYKWDQIIENDYSENIDKTFITEWDWE